MGHGKGKGKREEKMGEEEKEAERVGGGENRKMQQPSLQKRTGETELRLEEAEDPLTSVEVGEGSTCLVKGQRTQVTGQIITPAE